MRKNIYFSELTTLAQNKILDAFGANTPQELGLDKNPYAVAVYDTEGNLMRVELLEPAV